MRPERRPGGHDNRDQGPAHKRRSLGPGLEPRGTRPYDPHRVRPPRWISHDQIQEYARKKQQCLAHATESKTPT
ncbi:hypothetical protein TDMWS_08200 [Thermodesulfomicrobium sp. WS]|nr:hypothetical protein TDMWS_08200 [Thermodesulfomicrobium sp. WS]